MNNNEIIYWLLEGDVSIQYQVNRDLLSTERSDLRKRISGEGWGKKLLSARKSSGHWGLKFYQPKWTSTHYTLLDLRNLCVEPDNPLIKQSVELIVKTEKGADGGMNPSGTIKQSDVCLNGMFLNYASYFKTDNNHLTSVVDFILSQVMPDKAFNCMFNRSGARHGSLHSTLSVLEGITEYSKGGYKYRLNEINEVETGAKEFILEHRLFMSDRTGDIINKDFLKLPYPSRWRYDILRALDYFRHAGDGLDRRMEPAIDILLDKRNRNRTWNLQAHHPGQVHFEMEKAGKPSRWNTLRVLRLFKHFGIEEMKINIK